MAHINGMVSKGSDTRRVLEWATNTPVQLQTALPQEQWEGRASTSAACASTANTTAGITSLSFNRMLGESSYAGIL